MQRAEMVAQHPRGGGEQPLAGGVHAVPLEQLQGGAARGPGPPTPSAQSSSATVGPGRRPSSPPPPRRRPGRVPESAPAPAALLLASPAPSLAPGGSDLRQVGITGHGLRRGRRGEARNMPHAQGPAHRRRRAAVSSARGLRGSVLLGTLPGTCPGRWGRPGGGSGSGYDDWPARARRPARAVSRGRGGRRSGPYGRDPRRAASAGSSGSRPAGRLVAPPCRRRRLPSAGPTGGALRGRDRESSSSRPARSSAAPSALAASTTSLAQLRGRLRRLTGSSGQAARYEWRTGPVCCGLTAGQPHRQLSDSPAGNRTPGIIPQKSRGLGSALPQPAQPPYQTGRSAAPEAMPGRRPGRRGRRRPAPLEGPVRRSPVGEQRPVSGLVGALQPRAAPARRPGGCSSTAGLTSTPPTRLVVRGVPRPPEPRRTAGREVAAGSSPAPKDGDQQAARVATAGTADRDRRENREGRGAC